MSNESEPVPVKLDELTAAAVREDWDFVDSTIGGVVDNETFLGWAAQGLEDDDPNLRDLAASIFEKSSIKPDEQILDTLTHHMLSDDNPYARYRSAFALFQHGDRSEQVMDVIQSAAIDQDVSEIALGYLEQVEK